MADRRAAQITIRAQEREVAAYRAVPLSGSGHGILVVHDEWGLGEFARDVCDRLARAEFVALAPDWMAGERASHAAQADRNAAAVDRGRADAILERAVVELLSHDATVGRSVGALGFGVGGSFALALAGRGARVGAVVSFDPDPVAFDFSAIRAPLLAIFSGENPSVGAEQISALQTQLRASGVRGSLQTRPNATPGFMNDSRPDVHDAVAAVESWDNLLAFFRAELS